MKSIKYSKSKRQNASKSLLKKNSKHEDSDSSLPVFSDVMKARRGKFVQDDVKRIRMFNKMKSETMFAKSTKTISCKSDDTITKVTMQTHYPSEFQSTNSSGRFDPGNDKTAYKGIYVEQEKGKNLDLNYKTLNFRDVPDDAKSLMTRIEDKLREKERERRKYLKKRSRRNLKELTRQPSTKTVFIDNMFSTSSGTDDKYPLKSIHSDIEKTGKS